MRFTNKKDHLLYTAEQYNEQLRLDGIDFEQDSNAFESDFLKDSDIAYVICDGELDIKKTAENLEEAKIEKFKLDYKDEYPKDIINSFVNFMKEGVDKEELSLMHRIFEEYEVKPSANQFEKNLSDQLEEWKEIDDLFDDLNRPDIPDNLLEQKEILNVLSYLEYEAQTGYLWNDSADFDYFSNPEELAEITQRYFESDKPDSLYQSDLVEFTIGMNSFMVDTIDSSYSPYNIERVVNTISEELYNKSPEDVLEKITKIKNEFIRVNNIITTKFEDIVAQNGVPRKSEVSIQDSLDMYAENHKIDLKQDQGRERGL